MSDYNLTAELKRCAKSMRSGYITAKDAEHYREVYDKALDWIENPAPKVKPVFSSDGYSDGHPVYDFATCPRCEYPIEDRSEMWGAPYCCNCGVALDWSEVTNGSES